MTTDHRAAPAVDRSAAGHLVVLSSLAVVDVQGADAATFLQGQLSNDLIGGSGGGAGRACLAGYCNPKGRLLALPLVLPLSAGALRLLVPRELVDGLLQRLRMFVLRADVVFEPRETHRCHGLLVPEERAADDPLTHAIPTLPTTPPAAVLDVLGGEEGADGVQICRWHDASLPYPCRRYLIVLDAASGSAVDGHLGAVGTDEGSGSASADATGSGKGVETGGSVESGGSDGEALWRLGDISAGIPRIVAATREAFVPQMVNLQLIGALSFRKGCYPGQEIVARMQYLGKLKRHMRRFVVTPDTASGPVEAEPAPAIVPGDVIVAGTDAGAGQVVDAVPTAAGTELLAVVKTGAAPEAFRLHGAALEPRALPYVLPEAQTGEKAAEEKRDGATGKSADPPGSTAEPVERSAGRDARHGEAGGRGA